MKKKLRKLKKKSNFEKKFWKKKQRKVKKNRIKITIDYCGNPQ